MEFSMKGGRGSCAPLTFFQTWNLPKILHTQIFRLKVFTAKVRNLQQFFRCSPLSLLWFICRASIVFKHQALDPPSLWSGEAWNREKQKIRWFCHITWLINLFLFPHQKIELTFSPQKMICLFLFPHQKIELTFSPQKMKSENWICFILTIRNIGLQHRDGKWNYLLSRKQIENVLPLPAWYCWINFWIVTFGNTKTLNNFFSWTRISLQTTK